MNELAPTDCVTRAEDGMNGEQRVILLPTAEELKAGREQIADDIAECVMVQWDGGPRRWEHVADLRRVP